MKKLVLTACICLITLIGLSQNIPSFKSREITFSKEILLKQIDEYSNYVKKNSVDSHLKQYILAMDIQKFKQYTICNLSIITNVKELMNFNPKYYSLIDKEILVANSNISNFTIPDIEFIKYLSQTYLDTTSRTSTKRIPAEKLPDSIKIYDPKQKKTVKISSKTLTVTNITPQVTYPKSWTLTFDGKMTLITQTEDRYFQVY